jgi:hypothetical protein
MHYFVNKKFYKSIHLFSILSIPLVLGGARLIVGFMASLMTSDYYMGYSKAEGSGGGITYIILMELLSLFCFIAIKKDYILKNDILSYLYINLPLLTIFVPLVMIDGTMIRIGQYFTFYMMLLFPYAIDLTLGKKSRIPMYLTMIILLIFYMTQNPIKYEFCF